MGLAFRVSEVEVSTSQRLALVDSLQLRIPILDYRTVVRAIATNGAAFSLDSEPGRVSRSGDGWGTVVLGGESWSIRRVWAGVEVALSDQERVRVIRRRIQSPELLSTLGVAVGVVMLGLMVVDMASPSLRLMTHFALDGRGEQVLRPWFR